MRHVPPVACLLALLTFSPPAGAVVPAPAPTFEKDVRPILKAHCFHCHGEDRTKGGLDVRLVSLLLDGGGTGPAIVPGKPADSLLLDLVRKGEMPKSGKHLTAQEIATIERWIAAGAKTARPEPKDPSDAWITEEDRANWAFQPVTAPPPVPDVPAEAHARNPIDAFLFQKLHEKHLTFSPEADRRTLIRRLSFDLTGLPPSPTELQTALDDPSPDWYERLVDRLLASPHYAEHWARHWLDVAGYAESDGATDADTARPYAYKYRDYVIRSLEADKPWDQFIQEQLAGDELVTAKYPFHDLSPQDADRLIATGFLRMAPDGTQTDNTKAARNQAVAETIKVVSTSLLGLTVGCAQCHDHRYDPVRQLDYYRLRAVFDPAFDVDHWRVPGARLISLYTADQRTQAADIEARAKRIDNEVNQKVKAALELTFVRELAKIPEDKRDAIRAIRNTPKAKRTADQKKRILEYPSADVQGNLDLYDPKLNTALTKERAAATALRATKPVEDFIEATFELPGQPPAVSHLLYRGDVDQPRQVVQPGELGICATHRPTADLSPTTRPISSGRRLAYAKLLTDGQHPLVARVLVNRFWMLHFGRGIVATPGDFGALGERPTHPELLDYLAYDFTSHGWQLKRLHKLIVTSTAYRQTSVHNRAHDQIDPDNKLLGRMNLRRLEAETIRDALLAASGKLNDKRFGPSVPVGEDHDGQVIVGKQKRNTNLEAVGVDDVGDEAFRRSLYIQVRRKTPLAMLETFDFPQMLPSCDVRRCSTVAPQALTFMNDAFILQQSQELARRVRAAHPGDAEAQVREAFGLLFAAPASDAEVKESLTYLMDQERDLKETLKPVAAQPPKKGAAPKPPTTREVEATDPTFQALASFCQALMGTNRFVYID